VVSLEQLCNVVRRHWADDTTGRALRKIPHADLILIDAIGLLPIPADSAEARGAAEVGVGDEASPLGSSGYTR